MVHRGHLGFGPRYARADAKLIRDRERAYRAILRDGIDEHPPARAVELLRSHFDDADQRDIQERLASIEPRLLPPRAVPSRPSKRRTP